MSAQGVRGNRSALSALTGLRFVAAAHVVLYHFAGNALPVRTPTWCRNAIAHGYVGVSFFYLLSGFILSYNYAGLDSDKYGLCGTRRDFWAKRFSRIYPLYLFAWLLAAPLVAAQRFAVDTVSVAALKTAAAGSVSLSLLQAWIPGAHTWWNPPGWSISVEAFFCVTFPFLVPLVHGRRRPALLAVACYLLGLLVPVITVVCGGGALATAFTKYNPCLHLPVFVIGMLCAEIYDDPGVRAAIRKWGAFASTVGLVGVLLVITRPVGPSYLLIHNGLLTPCFVAIVMTLTVGIPKFRSIVGSRAMVVLGNSSYGIYILQVPLWLYWRGVSGPAGGGEFGDFVLFGVLLCGVAVGCYHLIERPAQRALRKRLLSSEEDTA